MATSVRHRELTQEGRVDRARAVRAGDTAAERVVSAWERTSFFFALAIPTAVILVTCKELAMDAVRAGESPKSPVENLYKIVLCIVCLMGMILAVRVNRAAR